MGKQLGANNIGFDVVLERSPTGC